MSILAELIISAVGLVFVVLVSQWWHHCEDTANSEYWIVHPDQRDVIDLEGDSVDEIRVKLQRFRATRL